ncbi:hypothetical protein [Archangium violaceum]|uniref:hypothetical protein n=1 Tax=Archangium violaceum TaxID=83451 RepID=UPI0036DB5F8D
MLEWAGFSPDGSRVLVAREALVEGRVKSTFQQLKRETLMPEKSKCSPSPVWTGRG